ncbi:hypothetical protein [Cytobacillus oceanisediminis]|uniref:hypothetical protein n=1 Tax=Cytobacillus oceanisediminis TaxID=665099 RepID=UPI00207A9275|nr:hypothetical protein [Cytobacillus oceanisediminis]USK43538.1 hypothetical protein LIT27_23605 [Cytobacillus oceanisediminis]
MPYIDKTFYTDVYKGTPVDADAFPRLLERACDSIDHLTNYALIGFDLDAVHQVIQLNVKKAVAAQLEYLSIAGEGAAHGESTANNVSIGNFSYSEEQKNSGLSREQRMISPAALSYLKVTGFLYRGVSVRG